MLLHLKRSQRNFFFFFDNCSENLLDIFLCGFSRRLQPVGDPKLRTHWREYVFHLAWDVEDLENAEERDVWTALISLLPL